MQRIIYGAILGVIAQICTFLQLQGQMRYDILKNNTWFLVLMGMPISYLYILSVKNFVLAFNGEIWPSRLLGFGIGVIIFTLMSQLLFKESITLKTMVCLFLSLIIIMIQIFWKN